MFISLHCWRTWRLAFRCLKHTLFESKFNKIMYRRILGVFGSGTVNNSASRPTLRATQARLQSSISASVMNDGSISSEGFSAPRFRPVFHLSLHSPEFRRSARYSSMPRGSNCCHIERTVATLSRLDGMIDNTCYNALCHAYSPVSRPSVPLTLCSTFVPPVNFMFGVTASRAAAGQCHTRVVAMLQLLPVPVLRQLCYWFISMNFLKSSMPPPTVQACRACRC